MLVLTRKPGESINVDLLEEIDPRTPVGELLAGGPIEVVVLGVKRGQVKLGLRADARFLILREELCRGRVRVGAAGVEEGRVEFAALTLLKDGFPPSRE